MKNLFKKIVSISFASLLIAACFCLNGCKKEESKKFIIGATGPLTGNAAVYGLGVKNAAQMAVDEINAAGGIDGTLFEFKMLDDEQNSDKIETLYSSLYEDGMQVSIGTVTSAPGNAFKGLSYEDNVFFITPSATANEITQYDNAYQMCFSNEGQGKEAARIVNEKFKTGGSIGILYQSDDDYSSGLYQSFVSQLNKGISYKPVSFIEDTTSFSSQINSLSSYDFIFMPIYYTPASLFIRQWNDLSISQNVTFFGCDGFDGIENLEGFDVNKYDQKITMLSHFNSTATTGVAGTFISKYKAKYGTATLTQFAASAYDCIYAIYYAMKEIYDEDSSKLPVTISASDLCNLLKAKFITFSYDNFVTGNGSTVSWNNNGRVNKEAIMYPINDAAKASN